MLLKEMCTFCVALPKAITCHQCFVISWIIVQYLIPQVERARRAIRVFFLIRELSLLLAMEPETQLPLTNPQACVQVNNVLDLSKLPNTDWNFEITQAVGSSSSKDLFRMCLVRLWAGH
jgi:hypothetical protein